MLKTLGVLGIVGLIAAPAAAAERRPNIVIILGDDLGYADMGSFGSEIRTPNLDSLAKEGVRFTGFYTHASCSPTRSMLLSGVDTHLNGLGNMDEWTAPNQWGVDGYEGFLNERVATLPALWAASYLAGLRIVTPVVGVVTAAFCLWASIRGIRSDLPLTRRVVRESIPVLFIAGLVDILAGTVVEARIEHFIAFPALLILIPPFLEDTNALSGILSSRLASKLHLGLIQARPFPQPLAWVDISITFLFAVVVFLMVGVSAELVSIATNRASPGLASMVGISMTAGFFATIACSAVAYYGAVATYHFGFDPDNHGIPIGSSLMDLAGTLCLVAAILLFGVTAHG